MSNKSNIIDGIIEIIVVEAAFEIGRKLDENDLITRMNALRWAGATDIRLVKSKIPFITKFNYLPGDNENINWGDVKSIKKDYLKYQKIMKKSEKMTIKVNREGLNVRNVFTEKDYKIIKDICKKYNKDIDADMII